VGIFVSRDGCPDGISSAEPGAGQGRGFRWRSIPAGELSGDK